MHNTIYGDIAEPGYVRVSHVAFHTLFMVMKLACPLCHTYIVNNQLEVEVPTDGSLGLQ